jgi:peptidoglycan/xylan/chitin deacetylase (PgdA/CDA1 family)
VLTFHRIVAEPQGLFELSWTSFVEILDLIDECGLRVSADLAGGVHGQFDAALTFDDATADHNAVGEELARRGLRGLFFVPTAKVGRAGRLTRSDLRRLGSLGHTLGSHGHRHIPLRGRGPFVEEVQGSKARLEAMTGAEVTHFAPPGGIHSRQLLGELRRGGYTGVRSLAWALYRSDRQRSTVPSLTVNEVSVRRGWVEAALRRRVLPPAARAVWLAKAIVPHSARAHVYSRVFGKAVRQSQGCAS